MDEALAAAVDALRRPLRVEADNGFRGLGSVKNLGAALQQRLEPLVAAAGDVVPVRTALQRLRNVAAGLDSATDAGRRALVSSALTLLSEIEQRVRNETTAALARPDAGERPVRARSRRLDLDPAGPPTGVRSAAPRAPVEPPAEPGPLDEPLTLLRGVGDRLAERLAAKGLVTVGDALRRLPARWEDRRRPLPVAEWPPGVDGMGEGVIVDFDRRVPPSWQRRPWSMAVRDAAGGVVYLTWFFLGGRNPLQQWAVGERVRFFGRLQLSGRRLQIVHPEVTKLIAGADDPGETGLVAHYGEVEGVSARVLRRIVHQAVTRALPHLPDRLPADLAARMGLMAAADAYRALHMPSPDADAAELAAQSGPAHRRLITEEFLIVQLGKLARRRAAAAEPGIAFSGDMRLVNGLFAALPFAPTGAQTRALADIRRDMHAAAPMHRLVQGDVGSGKTLVAVAAALIAAADRYQTALMAPTELVADQHAANIVRLVTPLGVRAAALTGRTGTAERRKILSGLAGGTIDILVGTHALIEPDVHFARLGLAIVDEQHRFGVRQRALLRDKGPVPDVLLLSATPIPRSLALTVYGDLDLSIIDEMPPGRTPVRTVVRDGSARRQVYEALKPRLARGEQAYVVLPLLEASERSDTAAATAVHAELSTGVLGDFEVGLVHGRMGGDEKTRAMRAFAAGRTQVLVATTVVEVGVDVPNATVMVVEHAERFGLSQLHQLRGRVGRGAAASVCVLLAGDPSPGAVERLAVLERTSDGFAVAEADLQQRGPGEYLGTRQAGVPDVFLTAAMRRPEWMEAARAEAERLLGDPALRVDPAYAALFAWAESREAERAALAGAG